MVLRFPKHRGGPLHWGRLIIPGQALEVLEGPFKERMLRFQRMVQAAHDMHPVIEADIEVFGQVARVKVDPLDVKGAA